MCARTKCTADLPLYMVERKGLKTWIHGYTVLHYHMLLNRTQSPNLLATNKFKTRQNHLLFSTGQSSNLAPVYTSPVKCHALCLPELLPLLDVLLLDCMHPEALITGTTVNTRNWR